MRVERCAARSIPNRDADANASGGDGRFGPMNPADAVETRAFIDSMARAKKAAAKGLRHTLPWHRNRTVRGEVPSRRFRADARRAACMTRSGAFRSHRRIVAISVPTLEIVGPTSGNAPLRRPLSQVPWIAHFQKLTHHPDNRRAIPLLGGIVVTTASSAAHSESIPYRATRRSCAMDSASPLTY